MAPRARQLTPAQWRQKRRYLLRYPPPPDPPPGQMWNPSEGPRSVPFLDIDWVKIVAEGVMKSFDRLSPKEREKKRNANYPG